MWPTASIARRILSTLSFATLSACTSIPEDVGRSDAATLLAKRGLNTTLMLIGPNEDKALESQLNTQTLSVNQAVDYALAHNPDIATSAAQLGFSAADLHDAGRVHNPILSLALLASNERTPEDQFTIGLTGSIADAITLPSRKRMAQSQHAAAIEQFAFSALNLANDVQSAYYQYLAAKHRKKLRQQAEHTAAISLKLAEQFYAAGNLSSREIGLERSACAKASLNALAALEHELETRVHLANLLGIHYSGTWNTVNELPMPPSEEKSLQDLIDLGLKSRLDFSAAKIQAEAAAKKLNVANWQGWVNELSVGYERERETSGEVLKGPSLEWELPIFSLNKSRLLRAESELKIHVSQLEALRLSIQNDIEVSYHKLKNIERQINIYQQELIPNQVQATQHAQEEQNFMLIGVFELIESKQKEYDSYEEYIDTVLAFWLARTELERAIGNRMPSGDLTPLILNPAKTQPVENQHQHHQH